MEWLFRGDYAQAPLSVPLVLLSLLLAFLTGQAIAWTYMVTHWGLSYSRTFVNALVFIPIITSAVMMVLSNNLIVAFGMMAVFAIVRFRNILRDTLDTAYILCCLVLGMACGTQRYPLAVVICVVIICLALYLHWTAFGSRHRYDAILSFQWQGNEKEFKHVEQILWKYAKKYKCATQRVDHLTGHIDYSFRLLMRDPSRITDLVGELKILEGISRISCMQAEDESEL